MKNYIVILMLYAALTGCVKSQVSTDAPIPFEKTEVESCLVIAVDLSGSFRTRYEEQGAKLIIEIVNQFFAGNAGSEARIVLSQLAGSDRVVLFEGTPRDFKRKFSSPDDLTSYLTANAEPVGSPVWEATGRTLRYVNENIAASSVSQKLTTVIVSDMQTSESDRSERIRKGYGMLAHLKEYQERGGSLALYCVEPDEVSRWNKIIELAGFKPGMSLVQNHLVQSPQLPSFE